MSRWRWPVAVLVGVLVLGTGGYAVARTRESEASYRTVTARFGDVERTLDLSGTVTAAGRRDLSFGAAGSVSKVAVRAGQRVQTGQVLARLDPTSFEAAVTSAVATLAKTKAQLASDEDAQSTAVTTAATQSTSRTASSTPKTSTPAATQSRSSTSGSKAPTASTPTSPPATATAKPDSALQKLLAQLAAEQKAVTAAQTDATGAITAAKGALTAQAASCTDTSTPEVTPEPTPSASPSTRAGDSGRADSSVSAECTNALSAVQVAQDTVSQKQDTLQVALTALGATLGQAVKATSTPGQSGSQSGDQSSGSQSGSGQSSSGNQGSGASSSGSQSSGSQSSSSQPSNQASSGSFGQETAGASGSGTSGSGAGAKSGSGDSVTAARLAQDQADIDTAQARLTQARAEREAATLRAPYAGRILQTDLAKGDLVAASDPAFVLVGSGATTVSTTVTAAQVAAVRRGQHVTVVPAGWTSSLTGTVSAIGLLPDSDSAYPVTITVSSKRTVAEGSTASVAVVTGSAENAVTVPVSALSTTGSRTTVQVLSEGKVARTAVTVGVVGTRHATLTKGLRAGAEVVLADLDATVPSGTTDNTQRARFGGVRGAGLAAQPSRRGNGG